MHAKGVPKVREAEQRNEHAAQGVAHSGRHRRAVQAQVKQQRGTKGCSAGAEGVGPGAIAAQPSAPRVCAAPAALGDATSSSTSARSSAAAVCLIMGSPLGATDTSSSARVAAAAAAAVAPALGPAASCATPALSTARVGCYAAA